MSTTLLSHSIIISVNTEHISALFRCDCRKTWWKTCVLFDRSWNQAAWVFLYQRIIRSVLLHVAVYFILFISTTSNTIRVVKQGPKHGQVRDFLTRCDISVCCHWLRSTISTNGDTPMCRSPCDIPARVAKLMSIQTWTRTGDLSLWGMIGISRLAIR